MSLDTTIRAIQKKLGVSVDGKPGPESWGAIHLAVIGKKAAADAGLDATIRAVQKKLGVFVDGRPGPETWGAVHLAIVGKKAPDEIKKTETSTLTGEGKTADSRSEKNIATLHSRVRPFARALIEKAAGQGIIIKVTDAMRTFAEQENSSRRADANPARRSPTPAEASPTTISASPSISEFSKEAPTRRKRRPLFPNRLSTK